MGSTQGIQLNKWLVTPENPGIEPGSPALQADALPSGPQGSCVSPSPISPEQSVSGRGFAVLCLEFLPEAV